MTRKLSLKKETLSALTTDELRGVVGGLPDLSGTTCPVRQCLNSEYNCPPSFDPSCMITCRCTPQTG